MRLPAVLCTFLALCFGSIAHAGDVPTGAKVRVRPAASDSGWHTGVVHKSGACTLVYLDVPTIHGQTALALNALRALQFEQGRKWRALSVPALASGEPLECRDGRELLNAHLQDTSAT